MVYNNVTARLAKNLTLLLTSLSFLDEIVWPDGDDCLPPAAVDLISRLLERDPLQRLGTPGAFEVRWLCFAFNLARIVFHLFSHTLHLTKNLISLSMRIKLFYFVVIRAYYVTVRIMPVEFFSPC